MDGGVAGYMKISVNNYGTVGLSGKNDIIVWTDKKNTGEDTYG